MDRRGEQGSLFAGEPDDLPALRAAVDRARVAWQQVRFHYAVGSIEETHAWSSYQRAMDRLDERLRRR
jgi:hypothetical protein